MIYNNQKKNQKIQSDKYFWNRAFRRNAPIIVKYVYKERAAHQFPRVAKP